MDRRASAALAGVIIVVGERRRVPGKLERKFAGRMDEEMGTIRPKGREGRKMASRDARNGRSQQLLTVRTAVRSCT